MSTPSTHPSHDNNAPIRVLVVDDSVFMRGTISRMLQSDPQIKVIDTAKNGLEALEKAKRHAPDVVTLDIEMPVMDGRTALKLIKRECNPPPAVLMCSSLTTQGSHEALASLRAGASDVIAKDGSATINDVDKMAVELIAKIKAVAPCRRVLPGPTPSDAAKITPDHTFAPDTFQLMLIGSSTGGPPVVEQIVSMLPADLNMPVVIAQHMPVTFTQSLAHRMDEQSHLSVVHGQDGLPIRPGMVVVCPGGLHTRVHKSANAFRLECSSEPKSELYRPSVNELFASGAKAAGGKVLSIICTGMGEDGLVGSRTLKSLGGTLLAQEASTCVVYGMPRAVVLAGMADGIMSPEQLAHLVSRLGASGARLAA
jgi:two-component system chemotaxis response regulator CheB